MLSHKAGRLYLALAAAASAFCTPTCQALASPRHTVHAGHRGIATSSYKPVRSMRSGFHKRTHVRLGPTRSAGRNAGVVHSDIVPLANTTWDSASVPPLVLKAIQAAARDSGIDPHLLAAIAWRESRFDPMARNHRSSAKGLLQFTTATWLQAVRDFGSQHDAANYAAAISKGRSGTFVVAGRRVRTAILQLRSDPVLSAKLAAESMSRQRVAMQNRLGRSVTSADLYLLHVLGPSGAARFLAAVAQRPSASSLEVAGSNVMYNAGLLARDGRPLTVANTYTAVQAMLDAQSAHTKQLLAATEARQDPRPSLMKVNEVP